MITVPEIVLERIALEWGDLTADNLAFPPRMVEATGFSSRRVVSDGVSLYDLSLRASQRLLDGVEPSRIGAVVAATFSSPERFPSLAVRVAGALGLSEGIPAFDLQIACSAYPYALYVAGRLACDLQKAVLVVDGDIQSRLTDPSDVATAPLFSDAVSATLVSVGDRSACSQFAFVSKDDPALQCPASGPIRMDGFRVFGFVARDVVKMLRGFGTDFEMFAPHQANLYMVRQLAKSLGLSDRLLTDGSRGNPGSASVPFVLAKMARPGRALVAGFGAGFSAAAATVRIHENFIGLT